MLYFASIKALIESILSSSFFAIAYFATLKPPVGVVIKLLNTQIFLFFISLSINLVSHNPATSSTAPATDANVTCISETNVSADKPASVLLPTPLHFVAPHFSLRHIAFLGAAYTQAIDKRLPWSHLIPLKSRVSKIFFSVLSYTQSWRVMFESISPETNLNLKKQRESSLLMRPCIVLTLREGGLSMQTFTKIFGCQSAERVLSSNVRSL